MVIAYVAASAGVLLALGFFWVTSREMAGKSWRPFGFRRFSRNGRPIRHQAAQPGEDVPAGE